MILPWKRFREGLRLSLLKKETFYSEAREDYYKPKITKDILSKKLRECLKKTDGNLVEAIRLMDIEFYTLPDNFLAKVDRSSMINSLEVRCPFLDYRLIEYSMKLPTKYKISMLKEKTFFREIISKILPQNIINQKKQGFTPPIGEWMEKKYYQKKLANILKKLSSENIISKDWKKFYLKEILQKNSIVANNYKIRLFLFNKWAEYWKII